jgi:hypothetical protein
MWGNSNLFSIFASELITFILFIMAAQTAIATGITLERNSNGEAEFVRISLRQYGDKLKSFFVSEGIEISPYHPEFVEKIKRSEQQIENGQYRIIKTQDLWT